MESFLADIHARDHVVKGKIGVSKAGKILAIEIKIINIAAVFITVLLMTEDGSVKWGQD